MNDRCNEMTERMRELNEALPDILLLDLVYLILGEAVILLFVPKPFVYAFGFFAGVLYAVFGAFHMSFRIRRVVYGRANSSRTLVVGYFVRLAVMLVLFAVLYIFNMGDLVCALIGMFAMKVSAYLQPFTHRVFSKIYKKGR